VQIVGKKYIQPLEEQASSANFEKLPLSAYIDQTLIERLHANDVILCDHVQESLRKITSCGIPHMLLAPMFLGKKLIGIFAIGKTDPTNDYTREDIMLVKAVAKITALVVERVRLLGEWARARANELALEKVNGHFDAFLNIASHELRTPLTTIKGNVQLALRRLETLQQQGVKQTETLNSTLERVQLPLRCAIQRADIQDQLITDLLDASRLHANQLVLRLQYCNLTEIVRNVATDMQCFACNQRFSLHISAEGSAFVLADHERMKQVIRNYISNAIKRSPDGEEVSISLDIEKTAVRFTAHDKGSEISTKSQEYIWEPFSASTSTDVSHYTSNEDLGLSLYLCKKIVEYHHGSVGLYSEPQIDTAFWFKLPLAETNSQSIPPLDLQVYLPSST
jgi:signal transduction histidine kinase